MNLLYRKVLAGFLLLMPLTAAVSATATPIEFKGASNTAGVGAHLPMELRVRHHLLSTDYQGNLDNTLIAFDYFFPTNFPELDQLTPAEAAAKARSITEQWVKQYQAVAVGLLPTSSEVSASAMSWIKANPSSSPARIVAFLSDPSRLKQVEAVNAELHRLEQESGGKLQLIPVHRFVEVLAETALEPVTSERVAENPSMPPAAPPILDHRMLFFDELHFNDMGQAVFFNVVLRPVLQNISRAPINEMIVRNLSDPESLQMRAPFLDSAESFAKGLKGQYWATFVDRNQMKRSTVELANGSSWNPVRLAEARKRLGIIAKIISKKSETGLGFPVVLTDAGDRQQVGLELTQAIFFRSIFLKRSTSDSDLYLEWGYDHWKYYMKETWTSTVPGTNYRFELRRDSGDPNLLHIDWYIFSTVDEGDGSLQADRQVRLPYLDTYYVDEITKNPGKYPYLKYTLDFVVISPPTR